MKSMLRSGLIFDPIKLSRYDMYSQSPAVLEGGIEYNTLCPVSKVTGHRTNPLDVLGMTLGPEKARLVNSLLQEIPVSNTGSDPGTFDYLVSRLDSGSTPAERDELYNTLYSVADSLAILKPDLKEHIEKKVDSISFDGDDVPSADS